MPRNGSGVFSLPAGSAGVTGTPIESAKYNGVIGDLESDANNPRPILAGGTAASTASAARSNLGLEIGVNVQAYDATLTSIAALGTAADRIGYTTGVDTWAETAISSFGRSVIDDADAATARGTLGIGAGIPQDSVAIPNAADLNSYTTPGFYHQLANAFAENGSNYPVPNAGALTVVRTGAGGDAVVQTYNKYYQAADGGPRMFIRAQNESGSWSSWEELLSSRSLRDFLVNNIGGIAMPQFLRRSATNASITYNSTYSGADLRRAGVQFDSSSSSVDWDQSGGIAPTGSFKALGAINARSGYYSGTLFLRIL